MRVLVGFFSFGMNPVTGGNAVVGRRGSRVSAVFPVLGFFLVAGNVASNGRIGWMTILPSLRFVLCEAVRNGAGSSGGGADSNSSVLDASVCMVEGGGSVAGAGGSGGGSSGEIVS